MVANLTADLGKETLEMNIDARGRQGLGVSVGCCLFQYRADARAAK